MLVAAPTLPAGGDLPGPWRRRQEGEERGVRGGRRLRVFWSTNSQKHVEGVRSGMFGRNVKL